MVGGGGVSFEGWPLSVSAKHVPFWNLMTSLDMSIDVV